MTSPMQNLTPEERLKIMERIKKLHAKAQSAEEIGSKEEAAAFAAGVQKTLAAYQLTMSDVEFATQSATDPMIRFYYNLVDEKIDPAEAMSFKHRVQWLEVLATALADAYNCEILFGKGHGQTWKARSFIFIGRDSAVQTARFVLTKLGRTGYALSASAYRKAKKSGEDMTGFYESWQKGYAAAIARRLWAAKVEIKQEAQAAGMALVRLDQEKAAAEGFKEELYKGTKLVKMGGLSNQKKHSDAYHQGLAAGRAVDLSDKAIDRSNTQTGQKNIRG